MEKRKGGETEVDGRNVARGKGWRNERMRMRSSGSGRETRLNLRPSRPAMLSRSESADLLSHGPGIPRQVSQVPPPSLAKETWGSQGL